MLSTEEVVGETVVNEGENDEEERPYFFGNGISVDIFYAVLVYRPYSGMNDIVKETILQHACLNSWVAFVFTRLEQKDNRGRH